MKKAIKRINFGMLAAMIAVSNAFAAAGAGSAAVEGNGICALVEKMHGLFVTLRTLAFLGAAFLIAGWAWGYITAADGTKVMDDLKKKGTGMLVGFVLLFSIGVVLQFVMSQTGQGMLGCAVLQNW